MPHRANSVPALPEEEDKSLPWEAQAITLADKIDNFWSIVVCAKDHGDRVI